ncbi:MAG TPA: DUF2784 domain-containing protein [Burkholderiales bacterium]|nr:DUF2784 domain-containing protein [Burkholderiales bacterium]
MNALFADTILVLHFGFVAFVVGGFFLILIGAWRNWSFIHSRAFRYSHLAAIVFVAVEALVGVACPLTVWEDILRGGSVEGPGFIERWIGRLMFYELPPWIFTTAYVSFAALVGLLLWLIPPRPRSSK